MLCNPLVILRAELIFEPGTLINEPTNQSPLFRIDNIEIEGHLPERHAQFRRLPDDPAKRINRGRQFASMNMPRLQSNPARGRRCAPTATSPQTPHECGESAREKHAGFNKVPTTDQNGNGVGD